MKIAFSMFHMHYMLHRRHGGVRRKLNVKTPFNTIEKWHELKPELFKEKPIEIKTKLLTMQQIYYTSLSK